MRASAVKREATAQGLPLVQPSRLSDSSAFESIRNWAPDLIVVAAYGQILRGEMLELPPLGCINVHASLLPRWRGAAPVQAAIAAGDADTGITIMRMDRGMDTGDIISQRSLPIDPTDTGPSLTSKLAVLGGELLAESLEAYLSGRAQPMPQDHERATKAPILRKGDGQLDPSLPAEALERKVRAFNKWPGAYLQWDTGTLKVLRAHVAAAQAPPGMRIIIAGLPAISTSEGLLVLDEVQPAGKRPMGGREFILGTRNWAG